MRVPRKLCGLPRRAADTRARAVRPPLRVRGLLQPRDRAARWRARVPDVSRARPHELPRLSLNTCVQIYDLEIAPAK